MSTALKEEFFGVPRWYAVRTKTTHEKRVSVMLAEKGHQWFLPSYEARRRWSDRIKKVELPLFPGYIFSRFLCASRISILSTPSVMGIAGVGRIPLPIDDAEIEAIRRAVNSGFGLNPEPFLKTGRTVRINSGSLEGLEGMIKDIRNKERLILSVTLLQRSVAVEIDSACVTVLPARKQDLCPTSLWPSVSYCPPTTAKPRL